MNVRGLREEARTVPSACARCKQVRPGRAKLLDRSLGAAAVTTSPVHLPSALPSRDDTSAFLHDFIRPLLHEIRRGAKVLWLLSPAFLVSGVLYLGHSALSRYRAQQQQSVIQVQTLTKRINEQERLIANLTERLDRTTQQVSEGTQKASDLKQTDPSGSHGSSLPTKLWNSYRKGTCLIAASYILLDPATARPLRYPEVELSEEEQLLTIGTHAPLTPDGEGAIFKMELVGTGFHVGDGYVLTNRHVVSQPWAIDKRAQLFISSIGAIPRMEKLLAFFPGHQQPIVLQFRMASKSDDVAVCTLKTAPSNIPVLPLDQQSWAVEIGRPVVMMAYSSGPERMLALLPESEATAIETEYGGSLFTLLDQLAKGRLVSPLTTQGHITDLYKNRIVFDASTGQGSSGAPVLGESGKVIGIAFAIFGSDRASNFAIPIAVGIKELKKAGWKPKPND